jgi:hypothetical protein
MLRCLDTSHISFVVRAVTVISPERRQTRANTTSFVMRWCYAKVACGRFYERNDPNGIRTLTSDFALLRDFDVNLRQKRGYLRRGKIGVLLFSCRIAQFLCPKLSDFPRARARSCRKDGAAAPVSPLIQRAGCGGATSQNVT